MNTINVASSGMFKKSIDGKLVENISLNADYNGRQLELDLDNNGSKQHTVLDNKALMKLLNKKISNKSLEQQLLDDFPAKLNNHVKKTKKTKRVKLNNHVNNHVKKTKRAKLDVNRATKKTYTAKK